MSSLSQDELAKLEKIAQQVRVDIIMMLAAAGSGHPGGSLSSTDILTALYFSLMSVEPGNTNYQEQDRFHLSKGHGCPAWYSVLARRGYFSEEHLATLRQYKSLLQGHPHAGTPGVEVGSGSLGQGLSIANGMALANRLQNNPHYVYCVMGDGELQEGQVWEAATFASHYKLDNLIAFVDHNGLQIDGPVKEVMNLGDVAERWRVFGFEVREIDGHNLDEIIGAVEDLKKLKGKPKMIVARTIKGKGVSFMEGKVSFHGVAPSCDEKAQALEELGGI